MDEIRRIAKNNLGYLENLEVYDLLYQPEYLLYAYQSLKKGVPAGIDGIRDRGITASGILKLSKELKTGIYKPNPTRRVMIPKAKKDEFRPLGIPSTKDKIVQNAIKLILENIFEPTFSNNSHGFRTNRSCHTALQDIEYLWPSTPWLIEFDFRKVFDKINYKILMSQLSSRFNDRKLLKAIWYQLKVGYVNPHNLVDSKLEMNVGTPQGSIISPILCNIFLDKLDKFIEKDLIPRYERKESGRTLSQEYLDHTTRWKDNPWNQVKIAAQELAPELPYRTLTRSLEKVRKENAKTLGISVYEKVDIKIRYIRYADDFLVGVRGSKDVARQIMQEIIGFCEGDELAMQINIEKSGIKHISTGVLFLGYKVFLNEHTRKIFNEQRIKHTRLMFGVPVEQLCKRYAEKGFLQKAKKGYQNKYVARAQSKYYSLEPTYMIRRYNMVVTGLVNYYKGSERLSNMTEFLHMIRKSAALTLAHQQKKKYAKYAFERWGKDLTILTTTKEGKEIQVHFEIPNLSNVNRTWMTGEGDINNLTRKREVGFAYSQTMTLIKSVNDLCCAIPECGNQAKQWHYIKHRRKIKGDGHSRTHILATAKQIPVCNEHHRLINNGQYDGPSLKKLKGYEIDSTE
uniref:putative reverse transcriptase/maturase n=1 Tax=Dixoniella grisea TaxID=35153 RepID=UPI001FCCE163|nr:putative reverse transcriptase/maturase [Dixoniella grisea]UNJ17101.1 putative reverse transcriptase/maturase [Dixoniella grisea]